MAENAAPEIVTDILEDEANEEKEFHDLISQKSKGMNLKPGMVHSATTDTLDSVYLEPPNPDMPDTDSELHLDLAFKEDVTEIDETHPDKDKVQSLEGGATGDAAEVSFSIEGGTTEIKGSGSTPSLSKYFGKEDYDNDPFASLTGEEQFPTGVMPKVGTESSLEGKIEEAAKDMVDLTLDDSKDFLENEEEGLEINLNNNQKHPDDLNIGSVDFDLALDKNDTVETPMTIEEKDTFESFTADIADTEALDALGMSPAAASFMTEKNITDYFRQTSNQSDNPFNSFSRQISQTSARSSSSQDRNSATIAEIKECGLDGIPAPEERAGAPHIPDIVPQSTSRTETELDSAESTPRHQPMLPPATTLSPVDSPVHQPFLPQTSVQGIEFTFADSALLLKFS